MHAKLTNAELLRVRLIEIKSRFFTKRSSSNFVVKVTVQKFVQGQKSAEH